jgi:WD40-like Beta Propeller Repeat
MQYALLRRRRPDLAVWDSALCPRAVLDAEDPDWSPDGSSIVFVRVATELGGVFGYRSVTRASV